MRAYQIQLGDYNIKRKQMSSQQWNLSVMQQILDKVRTLCKECNLSVLPPKVGVAELACFMGNSAVASSTNSNTMPVQNSTGNTSLTANNYLTALDQLRSKIYEFRQLEEEYKKLQLMLQKNQTQIRKHIGVEQQFKLYVDTIKNQLEESENDRLELLQNSKNMIKQIKAQNQALREKVRQRQDPKAVAFGKNKDISRKNICISRNKERTKSEYCSSLHIHHNRHQTQNSLFSPMKQRIKTQDYRIELTERLSNSKKKKVTEFKKKQNYTVMAYLGYKKRDSKDRNNLKRTLLNTSHKKRLHFQQQTESKANNLRSDKKAYKSVMSLDSMDSKQ